MQIKLHNSLTKKVEDFNPINPNSVTMYSCGPTVYNYAHIGNIRAFLFADLLQRTLRVVGNHPVKWVMNITNIDDKTIRDSQKGSTAWKSEMGEQTDDAKENLAMLTNYYEKKFFEDLEHVGIDTKDFFANPRATEYIDEMQQLIKMIFDKGLAYPAEGSIYFNVSEWRKRDKYGKLKRLDFKNMMSNTRIDSDQYEREQVSDFVIWKGKKENEPYWDFELDGVNYPGRPGWHIECSAMEEKLLGLPFDIHTGGIDLKFPHHEDEIAQSKAGYGIEPTNFFCHNEFLEVEGEKMSKSKGNFFTINDLIEKGIDPLNIRFSILSAHYASVFNFTFDGIKSISKGRYRIQDFIYGLYADATGDKTLNVSEIKEKIYSKLADDLHTPKALAEVFSLINKNNPLELDAKTKEDLKALFTELNSIFAVWKLEAKQETANDDIPQEIIDLANQRLNAKKEKNYALADELRQKISSLGYNLKDTKDGFEITKA